MTTDPLAQAIADLIKSDPEKYVAKFNFRSEICISCDWRRMDLNGKVILSSCCKVYEIRYPQFPEVSGVHSFLCHARQHPWLSC